MFIKIDRVVNKGLKERERPHGKEKIMKVVPGSGEYVEKGVVIPLSDNNGEPFSWLSELTMRTMFKTKDWTIVEVGGFEHWLSTRKRPNDPVAMKVRGAYDFLNELLNGVKEIAERDARIKELEAQNAALQGDKKEKAPKKEKAA